MRREDREERTRGPGNNERKSVAGGIWGFGVVVHLEDVPETWVGGDSQESMEGDLS